MNGRRIMHEAVYLALLALISAAVGKLWLDLRQTQAENLDCRVKFAEASGKIALLQLNVSTLQQHSGTKRMILSQAIVAADETSRITQWSFGAAEMFGFSEAEAVGHLIAELIVPESLRKSHARGMRSILESHRQAMAHTIHDTKGLMKNGKTFPVDIDVTGWRSGDGWVFTAIFHSRTIPSSDFPPSGILSKT